MTILTAKEAASITEGVRTSKVLKQFDFISRKIEEQAKQGEFYYICHTYLMPETKSMLEQLGYTVNVYRGEFNINTEINWRSV